MHVIKKSSWFAFPWNAASGMIPFLVKNRHSIQAIRIGKLPELKVKKKCALRALNI